MHTEVAPLLNSIDMADILFDFDHFTEDELRRWISLPSADRSGEERVKGIRRWSMSNWGHCPKATYNNASGRPEAIEEGDLKRIWRSLMPSYSSSSAPILIVITSFYGTWGCQMRKSNKMHSPDPKACPINPTGDGGFD